MCRTTLQRAFRLALTASGVTKQAHIHTLRHYTISGLCRPGLKLRCRARFLTELLSIWRGCLTRHSPARITGL
jgi:site-specific recombinase XerD